MEARSVLQEGQLFAGRWRVVRPLRAGGMGAVYEVAHHETKARSALKLMLPELGASKDLRARFRQEAAVTATIESDHIVKVFDAGTDGDTGVPYLVMELLTGEDLESRLRERGRLSPEEALPLLHQVARVIDRTHAAGVVHRDLKPANLFVTRRDDGEPCVKVLDFGIAKVVAECSLPETTLALGTPLYMSPEQIRGDGNIGPAADRYALGQIAYALLVGEPYWSEEKRKHASVYPLLMAISGGVEEAARERARRLGVALPEAFDAWFARATASAPQQRFASAMEQLEALADLLGARAALSGRSVHDATPGATPSPPRRRRWVGGSFAAALLVVTVGVWWAARQRVAPSPPPPAVLAAPPAPDASAVSPMVAATSTAAPTGVVGSAHGTSASPRVAPPVVAPPVVRSPPVPPPATAPPAPPPPPVAPPRPPPDPSDRYRPEGG